MPRKNSCVSVVEKVMNSANISEIFSIICIRNISQRKFSAHLSQTINYEEMEFLKKKTTFSTINQIDLEGKYFMTHKNCIECIERRKEEQK